MRLDIHKSPLKVVITGKDIDRESFLNELEDVMFNKDLTLEVINEDLYIVDNHSHHIYEGTVYLWNYLSLSLQTRVIIKDLNAYGFFEFERVNDYEAEILFEEMEKN